MRCQPVAMTGSQYLHTQRTITVPTAMLCAARSIHHSPLSSRLQSAPSAPDNAITASLEGCTSSSGRAPRGVSRRHRPATPSSSPATPPQAQALPEEGGCQHARPHEGLPVNDDREAQGRRRCA